MSLTNTRTRYRTQCNIRKIFITVNSLAVWFWVDQVGLKSDLAVHADLSSGGREFLSGVGGTRVVSDVSPLGHHLNNN